jgi:hypothetical protein
MNLQEEWMNMGGDDKDLSALISKRSLANASRHPLEKLKGNLLANALWGIAFSLGYCWIMLKFPEWPICVCLSLALIFSLWSSIQTLQLRASLQHINLSSQSLLQELELQYHHVQKWMSIQQQMGLFVYPFAATGGFLLGLTLNSNRSIDEIFTNFKYLISLAVVIVVLTPLGYWVARWMFRKGFGIYADQLRQNIDRLRSAE